MSPVSPKISSLDSWLREWPWYGALWGEQKLSPSDILHSRRLDLRNFVPCKGNECLGDTYFHHDWNNFLHLQVKKTYHFRFQSWLSSKFSKEFVFLVHGSGAFVHGLLWLHLYRCLWGELPMHGTANPLCFNAVSMVYYLFMFCEYISISHYIFWSL